MPTGTYTMDKIIRLNVGGTHYEVSRDTFERCKGSMLASLVSNTWKEGNYNDGPIFIDRSGRLFEYVLNYLRTNKVYLPPSVSKAAVEEELLFYGIDAEMKKVTDLHSFEHLRDLREEIRIKKENLVELEQQATALAQSLSLALDFFNQEQCPSAMLHRLSLDSKYKKSSRGSLLRKGLQAKGIELVSFSYNENKFELKSMMWIVLDAATRGFEDANTPEWFIFSWCRKGEAASQKYA